MRNCKIGDIVKLYSSDTLMTVGTISERDKTCNCLWHSENGELQANLFAMDTLQIHNRSTVLPGDKIRFTVRAMEVFKNRRLTGICMYIDKKENTITVKIDNENGLACYHETYWEKV